MCRFGGAYRLDGNVVYRLFRWSELVQKGFIITFGRIGVLYKGFVAGTFSL